MYSYIKAGLDKIEQDARFLRDMLKVPSNSQPLEFIIPPRAVEAVASCYIINAVYLLDEALHRVLITNFDPTPRQIYDLSAMIDYAAQVNNAIDAKELHKLRKARNNLAHELGQYRNWDVLDDALQLIRTELGKLGAL